jgi:hypothetical protein
MEYLNKAVSLYNDTVAHITTFIQPYKHITIESVNDDADIENQYEKVSKKVVVGLGNVFVNILILKVDFIKYLIENSVDQYRLFMEEEIENAVIVNVVDTKEKDE